ncbi:MAG: phosphopantetheine-binding protein [Planctomycetota bacterium]|jgi:acyl carrier protein
MSRFLVDGKTILKSHVVPVGYVVPHKEILLLDENGKPVTPGEAGEIAVKSRFLAAGYWRRPELTREKFLVRQLADGGEERTFLTGDLGRLDDQGRLVHLGRKDFQVKVRGYRIETAEVEQALLATGEVGEALVVGRDQPGEDGKTLVAYMVPSTRPAPTVTHLRSVLSENIPEYMVPTRFVFLDSMPRTATGKADRRALPALPTSRPELGVPCVAPRTPVEGQLSQMWSELLGISPVGVDDNFFDLGGHSLRAAQLLSRVSGAFGVDIPLPAFFESPTVAGIAPMITSGLLEGAGSEDLQRLIADMEDDPSARRPGREGDTNG